MTTRRSLVAAVGAALPLSARAQAWPTRPVRVVVPFAPGGSVDAVTRPALERLRLHFGQPFVLDNRGGAGGWLGASQVAASPPDGYTLLSITSAIASGAALQQPPADASAMFDAVAMLARSPYVMIVAADSPLRSVADVVRATRARADGIFYGSAGVGSSTHMVAELFRLRAGVRMQHVPYRGMGPAIIALIAGDVQVIVTTPASAAGQIRDGSVTVLAYTSETRLPDSPPAPTMRQAGVDCEAEVWWGMFAPRGTPLPVRAALNEAVAALLREPEIRRAYQLLGCLPAPMDLDDVTATLSAEGALVAEIVHAAGIRAE
jgi:tripartite-type tricarboxylate transporter receptor subunit TctC